MKGRPHTEPAGCQLPQGSLPPTVGTFFTLRPSGLLCILSFRSALRRAHPSSLPAPNPEPALPAAGGLGPSRSRRAAHKQRKEKASHHVHCCLTETSVACKGLHVKRASVQRRLGSHAPQRGGRVRFESHRGAARKPLRVLADARRTCSSSVHNLSTKVSWSVGATSLSFMRHTWKVFLNML